jgi:hypothetical protein
MSKKGPSGLDDRSCDHVFVGTESKSVYRLDVTVIVSKAAQ